MQKYLSLLIFFVIGILSSVLNPSLAQTNDGGDTTTPQPRASICNMQYLPTIITMPIPLLVFFLTLLLKNLAQYVIWPLISLHIITCVEKIKESFSNCFSSCREKCCCCCGKKKDADDDAPCCSCCTPHIPSCIPGCLRCCKCCGEVPKIDDLDESMLSDQEKGTNQSNENKEPCCESCKACMASSWDEFKEWHTSPLVAHPRDTDEDTAFSNVWVHWIKLGSFVGSILGALRTAGTINDIDRDPSDHSDVKHFMNKTASIIPAMCAAALVLFNNDTFGSLAGLIYGQHFQDCDARWKVYMKRTVRKLSIVGSIPVLILYCASVLPMMFMYCWISLSLLGVAYFVVTKAHGSNAGWDLFKEALEFSKCCNDGAEESCDRMVMLSESDSAADRKKGCGQLVCGLIYLALSFVVGSFYFLIAFFGALKKAGDRMVNKAARDGSKTPLLWAFSSAVVCDIFTSLLFQWLVNFAWMHLAIQDSPSYIEVFKADYDARTFDCFYQLDEGGSSQLEKFELKFLAAFNRVVQFFSFL